MGELALRIALLLIWAAVVSLDERAYGSFLLHQPLVAGSVAGALMGNLSGGAAAGLVLQCFWPGLLPVGGALLPSSGLGGVVAGSVTAWGTHLAGTRMFFSADAPLLFGVVLGLLAAGAGSSWEARTRRRNEGRESLALSGGEADARSLNRALRGSYGDTATRGIILAAAAVVIGGVLYLWPAGLRRLGSAPWPQWGAGLRLSALGLGMGGLVYQFHAMRRPFPRELIWGLLAGAAVQILRSV